MAGMNSTKDKGFTSAGSASKPEETKAKPEAASLAAQAQDAVTSAVAKTKDAAVNFGNKAQDMASDLGKKAEGMASDFGKKAEGAMGSVGGEMKSLAGTIRSQAPQGGALGSAACSMASGLESGGAYLQEHNLHAMVEDVGSMIRTYPLQAILVGLSVGFLVGRSSRS